MRQTIDGFNKTESRAAIPAFFVWKGYQRRSELLAPLLGSELQFFPHAFQSKLLRPLDYCVKFFLTLVYLLRVRPRFVVFQAPPLFGALAAICTKTPYVVDVHNALVQGPWSRMPLNRTFIHRAAALIAHNIEVETILKDRYPHSNIFTIPDPLQVIRGDARKRDTDNILFICSFDSDEPIQLVVDTVKALPEFTFTITADIRKLPRDLKLTLEGCANVRLTGFLATDAYHAVLCSSKAAVVLSTWSAIQPSGACEALASDTPLIVSRTLLTEHLFGGWAALVENNTESLATAIRSLRDNSLDLSIYRQDWNQRVMLGVGELAKLLLSPPCDTNAMPREDAEIGVQG